MTPTVATDDLVGISESFESAAAEEIVAWAHGIAGDRLVVTSSFSDVVLVDLVRRVIPSFRVLFIDTGFHFEETLAYVDRVAKRYDLRLEILDAGLGADVSPCGSADCCQRRKVEPLQSALEGEVAWLTGIRRDETPERVESPIVSFDDRYRIIKVNPLATWSHDDVVAYVKENDLPVHPLSYDGYLSIGCAPVTAPVLDPDDPRSGRWPDSDKTECGLHT